MSTLNAFNRIVEVLEECGVLHNVASEIGAVEELILEHSKPEGVAPGQLSLELEES